jgi:ATP-binding cassette subfamily F protein 3
MELLRFANIGRSYGARTIFSGLEGVVRSGDRIGIVGPNGAGKSTFVRSLVGVDRLDEGTIARERSVRIGYMSQENVADETRTLRNALDEAFARVRADEEKLRTLESEIAAAAEVNDLALQEKLLDRYGTARESFDKHGAQSIDRAIRATVARFNFSEDDLDRPTARFSGGQRTRAMLARVMLEDPDLLVLDEPTNHLDLDTVRWLEGFLAADPRAQIVVSHDRYFLERVATRMWELDGRGGIESYDDLTSGKAYTSFLATRDARREEAQKRYDAALAEEKRAKAVIAELRTHGSHNYVQVKSREKQLAKREIVTGPPPEKRAIGVALESARRATSGIALTLAGITKGYGAEPLFADIDLEVARGEKIAIVGPNGAGKSTLLRVIADEIRADRGTVTFGTGVRYAVFSQDANEELPAGITAVEAVLAAAPTMNEEAARNLLGRMQLTGDAGDKPVEAFSGGERRRIMLARLMARKADVLLLDEPTNDLDIASREALEDVLAAYEGAILAVSHDRFLLKRLAERVLWLHDGTAEVIPDGYEAYERRATGAGAPVVAEPVVTKTSEKKDRAGAKNERERSQAHKKSLQAAEKKVADLDRKREELERAFGGTGLYEDPVSVRLAQAELDAVHAELEAAMEAWERAMTAAEATV